MVCVALIMIVLLQTGKGTDMGAAFGGGSSQALFGSTGASTFLSKATAIAAVMFMLTSLCLAYRSSRSMGDSIMPETKVPIEQKAATDAPTKNPPSEPEAAQQPAAQDQAEKSHTNQGTGTK